MIKKCYFGFCAIPILVLTLMSNAHAGQLFLLLNLGDNADQEALDAGENFRDASDGIQPTVINRKAGRYFVQLPPSTVGSFAGSATRVGVKPPDQAMVAMAESVSEMADAGAAADEDSDQRVWIEFRAAAASLMLFSPDGTEQESDIRFEPARMFFLRTGDDTPSYVMITGKNGDPPPPDAID